MHFRPSGGLSANIKRAERAAADARAEILGQKETHQ